MRARAPVDRCRLVPELVTDEQSQRGDDHRREHGPVVEQLRIEGHAPSEDQQEAGDEHHHAHRVYGLRCPGGEPGAKWRVNAPAPSGSQTLRPSIPPRAKGTRRIVLPDEAARTKS